MRRFGIKVSKFRASPYEHLMEVQRYKEMIVELAGYEFKIADSLSFYFSFREIFFEEIYKFRSAANNPFIIDLGSNYGTSVVFFKTVFPQARIIAVEPDPKIFQLLDWNIKKREYRDVLLMNKAVTSSKGLVHFFREGADGGRIWPIEGCRAIVEIETVNLDDLIVEPVEFLKMDIEGAEAEVICSSNKLRDISHLFIEYHSFKDAEQSLGSILEKLRFEGFRYYIHKQFCSPRPFLEERVRIGQDLQLNIFANKIE